MQMLSKFPNRWEPRAGREPLKTIKELAFVLGIGHRSLAHMLSNKHVTPLKPKEYDGWSGRKGTIKTMQNAKYYSPSEFKRWWAEYNRVVLGGRG